MTLSIQESIIRLRAEILAPDWKLSPNRADLLKEAFTCLKQRFKNRKTPHDILIMAEHILDHGIKNNYVFIPPAIDFLKEAMANVVSLYEDPLFDPDREVKLLKTFQTKIDKLMTTLQQSSPLSPKAVATGGIHKSKTPPVPERKKQTIPPTTPATGLKTPAPTEEFSEEEQQEIERVMLDLETTIPPTERDPDAIRSKLETLVTKELDKEKTSLQPAPAKDTTASIADCPETPVRLVVIGQTTIGIPENDIALTAVLSAEQRAKYLKAGSVPLKDFSRFMKNLAHQFKGPLALLKESKLKQMTLPVMTPRSFDLPPIPDDEASALIVVGDGQWNGVILCAQIQNSVQTMTRFQKARNGDISGIGFLNDGIKIPLLNVISVLRREGFLVIP